MAAATCEGSTAYASSSAKCARPGSRGLGSTCRVSVRPAPATSTCVGAASQRASVARRRSGAWYATRPSLGAAEGQHGREGGRCVAGTLRLGRVAQVDAPVARGPRARAGACDADLEEAAARRACECAGAEAAAGGVARMPSSCCRCGSWGRREGAGGASELVQCSGGDEGLQRGARRQGARRGGGGACGCGKEGGRRGLWAHTK